MCLAAWSPHLVRSVLVRAFMQARKATARISGTDALDNELLALENSHDVHAMEAI